MYYLNDKHPKFEYALYCRVGEACPYIVPRKFDDIDEILRYIEELEKRHNRYNQIFYIDNDFYKNNYNSNCGGFYYKFLKRPVLDWEEFYTKDNKYNNVIKFRRN